MKPDLSNWLTKTAAAEALGISECTLDRMCDRGDGPARADRPNSTRSGGRPEAVYDPEDVERIRAARAQLVIAPASALQPRTPEVIAPLEVIAHALGVITTPYAGPWLTLEQASAHTGLSEQLLRRAIAAGELLAIRDRVIKVLRADLDKLDGVEILSKYGQPIFRKRKPRAAGGS